MPIQVDVRVMGLQHAVLRFERIRDRSRNLKPLFLAITRDFRTAMVKQFDSQGAYMLGRQWASLAESTLKRKQQQGLDMRILHATRKMRKSFTTGQLGVRQVGPFDLSIDSGLVYASFHQEGYTSRSGAPVPKRQIVKLTKREANRWGRMFLHYAVHGRVVREPIR